MQRAVEPAIGAPRRIKPLQHCAARAVDVKPHTAAYRPVDRRIRHRAPRSHNCRRHGQPRERCNRTPLVRRTRLSPGDPGIHAGAKTRQRRIKGNQELRVEAGSVAPVEFPIEHKPFNFLGLRGNRSRAHASANSPTQACLRSPPFLRRRAFRSRTAGRGPSRASH